MHEAFGQFKSLKEWSSDPRCVVSFSTIKSRLVRGMPLEEALASSKQPHPSSRFYEAFGEKKTLLEWANDPRCQVSRKGLRDRLDSGIKFLIALTTPAATVGSSTGAQGELYTAFGKTQSVHAWADDPVCEVSRTRLRARLQSGMSIDLALTEPPTKNPNFALREAFGEQRSLADWSRDPRCVVSYQTIILRLKHGMTVEKAISTPYELLRTQQATQYTAFGLTQSLLEWVADDRCSLVHPATLHSRVNRLGLSVEQAIRLPRMDRSSVEELKIKEYLESLNIVVEHHNRSIIAPKELDIYLPEFKLAIEYNGVYWHSEQYYPDTNNHFAKWFSCKQQGVQLIQIWQDEYQENPEKIHIMLKHKLGINITRKVFARKTKVTVKTSVKSFMDKYHVQGYVMASVHLGLQYDGELVAAMSFQQTGGKGLWELRRYATSCSVPGGFTKCLEYFKRNYEWAEIKTFSDLCVSDGALYEKAGFSNDGFVTPDYKYVVKGKRVHKFSYRKKRFANDPCLLYQEGMTEKELAELNNLPRIWDAGKIRWVLR